MLRRSVVLLALSALSGSCRDAPKPEPAPAPAALPTSSAPTLGVLSNVAEVEVDGLQVRTATLPFGSSLFGVSELTLDAQRVALRIVLAKSGKRLAELLPEGALAVVNGGYFEADFRPSTWLKDAGVELSPKSDTKKGGVLAVAAAGTFIGPFAELNFEPRLALQSFPLIVEAGGKSGIHRDDGRRAARTVACSSNGKLRLVVISAPRGEGPTLFESAALLRAPTPQGFGCNVALNLDGGPSTGVVFSPRVAAKSRAPLAPLGYAIAIEPR